jgi:uncharacterized membrane protein
MKIYEHIPRSVAKLITWRIVITLSNFTAGWLASGNPWIGLQVAGIALVVNSIIYYFHERLWNKSAWCRNVLQK